MDYLESRDGNEAIAQVAAEALECPIDEVAFAQKHIGTRYDNGDWDEVEVWKGKEMYVDVYLYASSTEPIAGMPYRM